jgi:hypothetical protein
VWLGVSIENARYTWRADVLREIPAAVRFISAEPLYSMVVRGWLMIGGEQASQGLPTSAALVGPLPTPLLPDAAEVDLGRWILWAPTPERMTDPICMVCVEIPLHYNY